MNRIGLLIVAVAVLMAVHVASSEQAHAGTDQGRVVELANSVTVGGIGFITAVAGGTRAVIGGAVSAVVSPVVVGMTKKTAASLEQLQPAIRAAPSTRATRARTIQRRVLESDSAALHSLADGRPIHAIRHAMRSRGLVDAVRAQVREETIY